MLDLLKDLFKIGVSALVKFLIAFLVGTAGSAVVCWYYGLPIALSVLGGFLVLGFALALMSDTIFD